MKGWKPIAAIVPGVALSFVNQWVGLFSHTPIPLPQWQQEADDTATALGVFVAVGVCMFWQDQPAPALRKRGKIFFFITLVLFFACLAFWFSLGRPPHAYTTLIQDAYRIVYIFAIILLIATIALGALSFGEEKPKLFWKLVIASLVVLVAIGSYFLWRWWHGSVNCVC